jgi:alpha-tubulin suppressor-like RCC1 family protein
LWSWGTNTNGGLGDNTITNRSSPVQTILYGNTWKSIISGNEFTAAIKDGDF